MADAWLEETGIGLDRGAEAPVGLQLAWSVRAAVRSGRLAPGERLPGARELADALGVNVNTVRAVIGRLVDEGLLDVRHGAGTFVAAAPPPAPRLAALVERVAAAAAEEGVDPRLLASALYVTPVSARPEPGSVGARRRELRREIALLERVLGELQDRAGIVGEDRGPAAAAGAGPRILGLDELEEMREAVVRRIAAVGAQLDGGGDGDAAPEGERAPEPAPAPRRRAVPRPRPA